jgi:hypothetical protein
MAQVKLIQQVSGTVNGAEWPAIGTVIEVSDEFAADLITATVAVPAEADDEKAVEFAAVSDEHVETRNAAE